MAGIPGDRLFTQPKYRPLLEEWMAAWFGLEYARVVAPCEVATNPKVDHEADFFLRRVGTPQRAYAFQSFEVMEPGRKRSHEYRNPRPRSYDFERGRTEGVAWLEMGVQKKVAKRYAGAETLNLLVYSNFAAADFDFNEAKRVLLPHQGKFASLWVMSHNVTASVFSTPDLGSMQGWTPRPGTPQRVGSTQG